MDKTLKIYIFKDQVIANMSNYLKSINFEFVKFEEGVNLWKEKTITIVYNNEFREISIYYSPSEDDKHLEFVLIHIHKFPINTGTASINKLLQKKGIDFESNFYKEGIDFENMVTDYCRYLIFLFDTYLKTTLTGEEWIDIPVDWYGYK